MGVPVAHSLALDECSGMPSTAPGDASVPDPGAPRSPEGEELLEVGRLVAAQGLGGELRVLPRSDFPERFTRPGRRWLRSPRGELQAVELVAGRQLPGRELFVVRLAGVGNRTAAEALVGHGLLASAADRPTLEPGEFHLIDLEGLEVRLLADGSRIGTVRDLIHGGNDLLEVELQDGGRRVLIPFVEAIVPEVHLEEGWVGLTPPPGLLEL
jgi:16S rRNA processing protein RimM